MKLDKDQDTDNKVIELAPDNNLKLKKKNSRNKSPIENINSSDVSKTNFNIIHEFNSKFEIETNKIEESSNTKNSITRKVRDSIKKNIIDKINLNPVKSISFHDIHPLLSNNDEEKTKPSEKKKELAINDKDPYPKRKSAGFTNFVGVPNLLCHNLQSNYVLKTKLFEKYLSDDEPANNTPQRITKNKLEEILTLSYFSPYNINYLSQDEEKKKVENSEIIIKEKDLKNTIPIKRLTSDGYTKNIFFSEEDKNNKEKENNINKDELTLDRIVYDINKQHISFNRRRTDVISNRKSGLFRKKEIMFEKEKEYYSDLTNLKRFISDYRNTLNINLDQLRSPLFLWRRVRIIVNVIHSILFLQKEMKLYGIRPSLPDYNFLNVNDYAGLDTSKYSFCNKKSEIIKPGVGTLVPSYIISPGSLFDKIFKKIFFFNLFIFIVIYPFRIGFYNDYYMTKFSDFFMIDLIMEFIFMFEFIVQCFTAFYNDEGNLEFEVRNIIYNYLINWFIFDLLCLLPFDLFKEGKPKFFLININYYDITKICKFIRIFKFGRIINNIKFVYQFQEYIHLHAGIIKLIYFFVNSIILCYTFACLWHFSSILDSSNQTWIYRYEFTNDSKWTLFLKSIYFGYTVFITIGYGDIVGKTTGILNLNLVEIILVCLWMNICALYYTFTLTSLSNIFLESNANNLRLNNKCLIIEEVFKASKLKHLIQKTIFYLKRNQDKEQNYSYNLKDLRNLLAEIPTSVKVEIARSMYNNCFEKIIVFRDLKSRSFIANVIPLLQSINFVKDSLIYSVDEVPEKMYFISSGCVTFTTYDNIVYQTLYEGSYFGEIEILRKIYRESNVLTKQDCQFLTLTKKIICNDIVNNYYEFFQILLKNMVKRWNFFVDMMKLIDSIIDEGKDLFNNELAKIVKHRLKIGFDKTNFNKYYFGLGILNRLEQLKKKNHDNKLDYNLEAIDNVFKKKESIEDHIVIKKLPRKSKTYKKKSKINLSNLNDNIKKDTQDFLLINPTNNDNININSLNQKAILSENKEILSLLTSLHNKLDNFIDKERKQIAYDLVSKNADARSLKSLKDTNNRLSIFMKLNSLKKKEKPKKKLVKIKKEIVFKRLKTLNFNVEN